MIRKVILLAIFAFLGGCTSSQDLIETGRVTVDIEENTQARVNQITAYQDGEEIVIRGTVRRPGHRMRPLWGHVDLQIETADGTKVEQTQVELVRYGTRRKNRRARFIARVILASPRETLVRLRYHEGSHETGQKESHSLGSYKSEKEQYYTDVLMFANPWFHPDGYVYVQIYKS